MMPNRCKSILSLLPLIAMAGCSGPQLSPQAQSVHTISDTTGCTYVLTEPFTGVPATLHNYIKQRVVEHGGNAYKVLSSDPGDAWGEGDVDRVTYEVWRCQ